MAYLFRQKIFDFYIAINNYYKNIPKDVSALFLWPNKGMSDLNKFERLDKD